MINQSHLRSGFENYLGTQNLPRKIDPDRLTNLVERLRTGDNSVSDEIINGHLRLAASIVSRYAGKYPYKTDDLVAVACLGVTQAVAWAHDRLYDNNITPYIYATALSHIKTFLECDQIIAIPRKTFKKRIKASEDKQSVSLNFVPFTYSSSYCDGDEENQDNFVEQIEEVKEDRFKSQSAFDEMLASVDFTPREKLIIQYIYDGLTIREIARLLCVSHTLIWQIKSSLTHKIRRYYDC